MYERKWARGRRTMVARCCWVCLSLNFRALETQTSCHVKLDSIQRPWRDEYLLRPPSAQFSDALESAGSHWVFSLETDIRAAVLCPCLLRPEQLSSGLCNRLPLSIVARGRAANGV